VDFPALKTSVWSGVALAGVVLLEGNPVRSGRIPPDDTPQQTPISVGLGKIPTGFVPACVPKRKNAIFTVVQFPGGTGYLQV
jgi:hypothetical protein